MANKEMTLNEQYENFKKELGDIIGDAQQNSRDISDTIARLEKLVYNPEGRSLKEIRYDIITLQWSITDFKRNKEPFSEVWSCMLRTFERATEIIEKPTCDIRTFCLECAKNSTYPEKVRKFFKQCAENAHALTKIVDIN